MTLNIIVGIKWVPNTTAVNIDQKTGTLIRTGTPSIINPPDLNALELALQLKDRYGGTVTALTMGPPMAKIGLEHAIGIGCDKGVLISDQMFAGADTLATSYTLSKAIQKIEGYNLVIVGQETVDSSTAHIGAQIASWLDLPFIYYVTEVNYSNGNLLVKRLLENSYEEYDVQLPALISTSMHSNSPRKVKLMSKLRTKTEGTIDTWNNAVLGLNALCIGLKGSPTFVAKTQFMAEVARKKEVFKEKDSSKAAEWLVNKLNEDKLLSN